MKSRNLLLVLIVLLAGNLVYAQKALVNTQSSSVEWLGKKIGGQHNGDIMIKSGYLKMDNDMITGGEVVIDMTSITNEDIDNETYNQKLVGHLKSDDFFGVEKFPTANFVIKEGSKFKNGKATVTGDITIKGTTETITFDVMKSGNSYSTKIELDRSKFDVRYGSTSFFDNLGDKAIDDIFTLDIKLVVS